MASDTAAKAIMKFAKNRLNKFYNPKLYKPPAKASAAVFAQVSQHSKREAPPPPPESFGAYTKKTEDSMGVMAMMDLLIADLDKEMTEAETEEKDAQEDYEQTMKDSAEKRTKDSKLLGEKESTKADLEADLETHTEDRASTAKELMAMLKYFDVRKEARTSEIDALGKAKAVLAGADFSLLQTRSLGFLWRAD